MLTQAAAVVSELRAEGKTVLLHCVAAHSRTPTIAALYAARHLGVEPDEALDEVVRTLKHAHPKPIFQDAVLRLGVQAVEEQK